MLHDKQTTTKAKKPLDPVTNYPLPSREVGNLNPCLMQGFPGLAPFDMGSLPLGASHPRVHPTQSPPPQKRERERDGEEKRRDGNYNKVTRATVVAYVH